MIIKYEKGNLLNATMFILYTLCYLISLTIFGMGTTQANIRYYILFIAVISNGIIMLFKKNRYKISTKNIVGFIILSIYLLIESYIKAKNVGMTLAMRTLIQISLTLLPALYAYELTNTFSMKSIINMMKFTLVALIIVYFLDPKHSIFQFLNISNWLAIDITKSISFTESNICAESFLQLFLFFLFFSDAKGEGINPKTNKKYMYIALIFTILSFKRLGLVFSIFMLFIKKIADIRAEISKKFILLMSLLFTILTFIYTKVMMGEIFTDLNLFELTTGRDYILSLWEKHNYFSYGYGTSLLVMNKYLEMDLVQIYLELNIFAVFIFCFFYFNISKKSFYSFAIMTYSFANMLTASSLPYSLGWIILFITIFCISSKKYSNENITIQIQNNRFKKIFQKRTEKYEKINN